MPGTESGAKHEAEAAALVARLAAEPRPAGGAAEARARAMCAVFLTERGFEVREEPFAYSAFPGRWATPLGGAASVVILTLAGHAGYGGSGARALGTLVVGGVLVALTAWWLARVGVLDLPLLRRAGVNLVARRGGAARAPRVWLVAHLDSKSQPVPIGARAAGIVVSAVVWVVALGAAFAQSDGGGGGDLWRGVTVVGWVAAVPVLLSVVGERSPGALDNATGVAAALLAAGRMPNETPVGVLLTSAEELGLAGARAWARRAEAPGTAINFDGLDDAGTLAAMYTGVPPFTLVDAVRRAATAAGLTVALRPLLPGILVDGVALAARGWQVVTLSRGTLATVSRIHRPGDTADRLTGAGVAEAARVAAGAVALLTRSAEG